MHLILYLLSSRLVDFSVLYYHLVSHLLSLLCTFGFVLCYFCFSFSLTLVLIISSPSSILSINPFLFFLYYRLVHLPTTSDHAFLFIFFFTSYFSYVYFFLYYVAISYIFTLSLHDSLSLCGIVDDY